MGPPKINRRLGECSSRYGSHKHLGIYLTSTLDWSLHVQQTLIKAYRKLSVLRSVRLLHRNTLDLLYKLTIRSVIDYGLVVFGSSLKLSDLNRLEQLQYKAGKLVTGALHLTSAEKLNNELGWESIKTRTDFLGMTLFYKINGGLTRPLLKTCMTSQVWKRNSRQFGHYTRYPNYGVKFLNSFFPYFSKKWNQLDRSTVNLDLEDFKQELKVSLEPVKHRHYSYGSRLGNKLLTRLRLGRTFLNSHGYAIGKVKSPECLCHNRNETTKHFMLDCWLYTIERTSLFDQMNELVTGFDRLSQKNKLDILLFGYSDTELLPISAKINLAVQKFIIQTKCFCTRCNLVSHDLSLSFSFSFSFFSFFSLLAS